MSCLKNLWGFNSETFIYNVNDIWGTIKKASQSMDLSSYFCKIGSHKITMSWPVSKFISAHDVCSLNP